MNYTHFVSVAGLVSNDKGEILLINSPRRGWEYPGGMVEPGETFQDALDMVTFPLTRKRLQNMLSESDKVNCFCFIREPFEIVAEDNFNVGKR